MRLKDFNALCVELMSVRPYLAFITGPTGAGKSTLVSNLGNKLQDWTVHPGKEVRKDEKLKRGVLASANPTAPPVTEKFVRELIKRRIEDAQEQSRTACVVIDGMPRSLEQVTFCVDLAMNYDKALVFVYLEAAVEERRKRLVLRGDSEEFISKRVVSDEKQLPFVLHRIKHVVFGGKYGYFYEINTNGGRI